MQIYTFGCFGEHADGGNPALVIEDDRSSSDTREAFARQHNVTCVWIELLGHGITLRQGRAVGSANLIRTRTDGPDILVGGLVQAG